MKIYKSLSAANKELTNINNDLAFFPKEAAQLPYVLRRIREKASLENNIKNLEAKKKFPELTKADVKSINASISKFAMQSPKAQEPQVKTNHMSTKEILNLLSQTSFCEVTNPKKKHFEINYSKNTLDNPSWYDLFSNTQRWIKPESMAAKIKGWIKEGNKVTLYFMDGKICSEL